MAPVEIVAAILCIIIVIIAAEVYWKRAIKSDLTGKSAKVLISILTLIYFIFAVKFHQIDLIVTAITGMLYLVVIYPHRTRKNIKKAEEGKIDHGPMKGGD